MWLRKKIIQNRIKACFNINRLLIKLKRTNSKNSVMIILENLTVKRNIKLHITINPKNSCKKFL